MFVRSAKNLYCVMDKGDKVDPAAEMLAQADEPEAQGGGGYRGGGKDTRPDRPKRPKSASGT